MKILIIDLETTGFLNSEGKIVEVGIVELDLTNGEKKIIFDYVCHEKEITIEEIQDSWIVKNSTLSLEQIKYSQNFEYLKPKIESILKDYPLGITAFNNTFDFGFLENRGIKIEKKLPCPMKLSTDVCKIPSPKGGYKWPKVEEAHKFFFGEVGYIEAHRGADDAFHEADIVYMLYKIGVFKV